MIKYKIKVQKLCNFGENQNNNIKLNKVYSTIEIGMGRRHRRKIVA